MISFTIYDLRFTNQQRTHTFSAPKIVSSHERTNSPPSPPRSGGEGRGEVVLRVPGAKHVRRSAFDVPGFMGRDDVREFRLILTRNGGQAGLW